MKKTYICTSKIPIATKTGIVVTYGRKTSPAKSHDLFITWSCDNRKTLYMHFCNTYSYQTWESVNLQWGTPPSKSRELLIMWSRGKWKKTYIYTSTISMASRLGRVATYSRKTSLTKSRDLLIACWRANEKSYNCISTIVIVSKFGRVVS